LEPSSQKIRATTYSSSSGLAATDCLFCSLASDPAARKNPEDQILIESRSFYVKPGLGHFTEGYILVNSRAHRRSLSFLTREELAELDQLKAEILERLAVLYGRGIVAFEHGEVNPKHHPGCCLEHAHLHILPLPDSVSDELVLPFESDTITSLTDLSYFADQNISYLYYENRARGMFVYRITESLPSQFLRREFCARLGIPDSWDWAVFPFRKEISVFTEKYKTKAAQHRWEGRLSSSPA